MKEALRTHTVISSYSDLVPDSVREEFTLEQFRDVIVTFFDEIAEEILKGENIDLGHNIGSIRVKKITRGFKSKSVDFGETNKLKAEGIDTVVFHTSDTYYRIYWNKRQCKIKNKTVYMFKPSRGREGVRYPKGGLKTRMKEALKDPYKKALYNE